MKVSLDAESVSSIRKICSVAPKNVTLPGIDGVLIESDDSEIGRASCRERV